MYAKCGSLEDVWNRYFNMVVRPLPLFIKESFILEFIVYEGY
jgi:hypothetical protein